MMLPVPFNLVFKGKIFYGIKGHYLVFNFKDSNGLEDIICFYCKTFHHDYV